MRILVTGSAGMAGVAICKALCQHNLVKPRSYELNVANRTQVMRFKKAFDCIIHLAAETDHEYCEENPSQCYLVNTIGTGNMVDLARSMNCPILYLSAGSIFDGLKKRPYRKNDIPNPINHYNRSKHYAEILVRAYPKHWILRAGWMFGGGEQVDKKFVNKIIQKIKRGFSPIDVCDDCVGSPTYNEDLAEVIHEVVVNKHAFGTYHAINPGGGVSRYDLAKEIVSLRKKWANIVINKVKIKDLKDEFPCKRTNYEVLETDFDYIMRDWRKSLKSYLTKYYEL